MRLHNPFLTVPSLVVCLGLALIKNANATPLNSLQDRPTLRLDSSEHKR